MSSLFCSVSYGTACFGVFYSQYYWEIRSSDVHTEKRNDEECSSRVTVFSIPPHQIMHVHNGRIPHPTVAVAIELLREDIAKKRHAKLDSIGALVHTSRVSALLGRILVFIVLIVLYVQYMRFYYFSSYRCIEYFPFQTFCIALWSINSDTCTGRRKYYV